MNWNCNQCSCKLLKTYVKHFDTEGNPYCQVCYVKIGGVV